MKPERFTLVFKLQPVTIPVLERGKKGVIEFMNSLLVGSFNPFEKYESNRIISVGRDENKPCLKPPPSLFLVGRKCCCLLRTLTIEEVNSFVAPLDSTGAGGEWIRKMLLKHTIFPSNTSILVKKTFVSTNCL